MIEKLKPNEDKIFRTESGEMMVVPALNVPQCISDKINEVIDAVNELQTKVNKLAQNINFAQPEVKENVQDKFAEQRRWIGKLCRFRDYPACEWRYGILYKIYEDNDCPFWDADCNEYRECEPVKPDDDIIYKGGDNE